MSIVLIHSRSDLDEFKEKLQSKLPNTKIELLEEVKHPDEVEYAISWKHPHGVFANFKNLKVVASFGAGVDHIFSDKELPKDIKVTKIVNEQLTKDMCDYVLMCCFNFIRNTLAYKTEQNKASWNAIPYLSAKNVHVGILGLGNLGSAVAKTLVARNFKVSGWANTKKEIVGVKTYTKNQLNTMLPDLQILVCLLPLTQETHGILNSTIFQQLPQQSAVINVARGEHLNEKDLRKAIEDGYIKTAFLDVFQKEPLPKSHWFWHDKAIHITPHVASTTQPNEVLHQLVENYKRFKNGQALNYSIDLQRGY